MNDIEEYKGIYFYWIEEWSQLLGGCNWYTFHAAQFEFEWERNMGGVEATVVLLGLGFRVRWNYAVTPIVGDIKKTVDSLMDEENAR